MSMLSRRKLCRTAWGLFLLLYHAPAVHTDGNQCNTPLGLQDGTIPNSSITSSAEDSEPDQARLNGAGAWCFKVPSDTSIKKVTITIDLGESRLVSGVQTQGPPASMFDPSYNHYISFKIHTFYDDGWELCCGDVTQFHANDRYMETDVVTTHPLSSLVLTRRIRLSFKTNLRLDDSDTKCFRLEVLGCPPEVEADSGVSVEVEPGGWLLASWQAPVVQVPVPTEGDSLASTTIPEAQYVVNVKRTMVGLEDEVLEKSVNGFRFMMPSPLWRAKYTMKLNCVYAVESLNITCGSVSLEAVVSQNEVGPGDQVVFRGPSSLQAAVLEEGRVEVSWGTDSRGWLTTYLLLNLYDKRDYDRSEPLTQVDLTYKDTSTILEGLTEGSNCTLVFTPVITDFWRTVSFSFDLYLIPWELVKLSPRSAGYGAFLTEGGLTPHILWNGTLRLTFGPAIVRGEDTEATEYHTEKRESGESVRELNASTNNSTEEFQTTDSTTEGSEAIDSTTKGSESIDSTTEGSETPDSITEGSETTYSTTEGSEAIDSTTEGSETTDSTTKGSETTDSTTEGSENTDSTTEGSETTDSTTEGSETTDSTTEGSETPDNTTEGSETKNSIANGTEDTPMPETRNEARAIGYTVLVTCEDGNWTVEVGHEDDPQVDMPILTLEKHYNITLICHFGKISIKCGYTETYTELPLYSTYLEGVLVVYEVAEGRGSWAQQEAQCRLAGGTVVSLATRQEDTQLQAVLTNDTSLDTFWLGLKMCAGGSGSLWSDGSKWPGYREVSDISRLSATACCVKATWDGGNYGWVGEACDALLPAICEYHPEEVVGGVTELERGEAGVRWAEVTWSYERRSWTPTAFTFTYCYLRNLLPNFDNSSVSETCHTTQLGMESQHRQEGLEPFSEYTVRVWANIQPINYTGEPASVSIRTYPEVPVMVTIDKYGFLYVIWTQKVAEFGEEDDVMLEITNATLPEEPMHKRTIKAVGATFDGLKIGETYSVSVKEHGNMRRKENVTFPAYPTCECGRECQVGGHCFLTLEKEVNAFTANEDCKGDERSLATATSKKEVDLLLKMADTADDDLWISQNSNILRGSDAADTAALLEMEHEEVLENGSQTSAPGAPQCLLLSKAARAVVQEPCTDSHKIACSYKAPVALSEAFSNMTTSAGGTWITVDWNTTTIKWWTKYRVRYLRTRELRYKKERLVLFVDHPPVTLTQLQPDTSYTVELRADLGEGYVFLHPEFPVFTTNETETKPVQSGELVLGSTGLGRDDVIQLVCNSLLVAASITTMLLFFATGMFYQDCVAQLGFQSTLLAAYLNLILAHPSQVRPENEVGCVVLAVVLHFLFMCAFMFLMLEALTIAHLLVVHIRSPFQRSNWLMMLVGFAVPLLVVGVSAGFVYTDYSDYDRANCWLNPLKAAVWTEAVPNLILVIAIVFLLFNTICTTHTSPELITPDLRGRQSDSHKLRWVVLALTVELSVVWATGVAFYQLRDQALLLTFCVFTIILALTIICARTWFDDTFRSKMHRLCCGTELTYKRSEILSISARARVSPSSSASSPFVSSEEHTHQETTSPSYSLPNTPSEDQCQQQVLVRRTYNFSEDEPISYY